MKRIFWGFGVLMMIELAGAYWFLFWNKDKTINQVKEIVYTLPTSIPTELVKNIVEIMPTKTIVRVTPRLKPKPTDSQPWGVSKQIGELTWTIKVGQDEAMATPKEILGALNQYRQVHGSQVLTWNEKLANFAQERAIYLNKIKTVDQHKGFSDFLENQDGFNKIGFTSLGENISYGYQLNGVHTIEWMYAGDKPHNDNQLNNRWNYVGIGVEGLATSIIFGAGKM